MTWRKVTIPYTCSPGGVRARVGEAWGLWRFYRTAADGNVRSLLSRAEECGRILQEAYGVELSGQRILEVGAGPFLVQSKYFALRNEVVAIDAEVAADRLTPAAVFEMARRNGVGRAARSVARKLLGVERAYIRALRSALGVSALPKVDFRCADAAHLPFPDASFDVVYSRAMLHHLVKPAQALSEMARVLRVGGVAYVDLHLYTSFNGSLHYRVLRGDGRLYWAHLHSGRSRPDGARLNRLRLGEWQRLLASVWPGSEISLIEVEDSALRQRAGELLASGTIVGYSLQELLTITVVATWKNAGGAAAPLSRATAG